LFNLVTISIQRLATPISNYQVLLENITIAKFEFFISLKFTIHLQQQAYIPPHSQDFRTRTMATANYDDWFVDSDATNDVDDVVTYNIFICFYDNGDKVPILSTPDFLVFMNTMVRLTKEAYTDAWYEYIYDLLDKTM
jgi:hypothetical protein